METQKEVDMFFDALIHMMSHYKVSGIGRDSVLELITKNIDRLSGIHWTRNFLESTDGECIFMFFFILIVIKSFYCKGIDINLELILVT